MTHDVLSNPNAVAQILTSMEANPFATAVIAGLVALFIVRWRGKKGD